MKYRGVHLLDVALAMVIVLLGGLSAYSMVRSVARGTQDYDRSEVGWRLIARTYSMPKDKWQGEFWFNRQGIPVTENGYYQLLFSQTQEQNIKLYVARVVWRDEIWGPQELMYSCKEFSDESL